MASERTTERRCAKLENFLDICARDATKGISFLLWEIHGEIQRGIYVLYIICRVVLRRSIFNLAALRVARARCVITRLEEYFTLYRGTTQNVVILNLSALRELYRVLSYGEIFRGNYTYDANGAKLCNSCPTVLYSLCDCRMNFG